MSAGASTRCPTSLSLNSRIAHERLLRICFGDYDREMVLVAEQCDAHTGRAEIVGVGRLNKLPDHNNEAEVAVLVSDRCQNRGLGLEPLRRVIQVAREEKVGRVSSEIVGDNVAMQVISRRLGFRLRRQLGSASVKAVLEL
ncbi:MAG: sucD 1 [Acidobacteriaceae bacterium]|jgi:acetyltransferase|nr:sucD 1 [Acidobacteriaceae bacterium]